jgi:hypothetical protein
MEADMIGIAVREGLSYWKRARRDKASARQTIEREGGQVMWVRRAGMILHTPFHGLRLHPLYYQYGARYDDRVGAWIVATSDEQPDGEWVWVDKERRSNLPVHRGENSRVDNTVVVLGPFSDILAMVVVVGLAAAVCCYFLR